MNPIWFLKSNKSNRIKYKLHSLIACSEIIDKQLGKGLQKLKEMGGAKDVPIENTGVLAEMNEQLKLEYKNPLEKWLKVILILRSSGIK